MRYLVGLLVILATICIIIVSKRTTRNGKFIFTKSYSYKKVIKLFILINIGIIFVCFLIYMFSKSFEVAISLGAFMIACTIAGFLRVMLTQSHIKARGGKKEP
jgi:hypothetical protein